MNARERLGWGVSVVALLSLGACSSGSSGSTDAGAGTATGAGTGASATGAPSAPSSPQATASSTPASTTRTIKRGQQCGLISKSKAAGWLGAASVRTSSHVLLSVSKSLHSVDDCLFTSAAGNLAYNVYTSPQVSRVAREMHAQFEANFKKMKAQTGGLGLTKITEHFGTTSLGGSAQIGGVGLAAIDFAKGQYAVLIISNGTQARASVLSVAKALDAAIGG